MNTVPDNGQHTTVNTSPGKLAVGWALVGVPLAYGVYETLTRVATLFG